MSDSLQGVRFAWRTHRTRLGDRAGAVPSLEVAIGGRTAVFSLVSQVLFAPTSQGTFADLAEPTPAAQRWGVVRRGTMRLRGSERAEPVTAARVTGGFFDLMGVQPARGRASVPREAVEGGPRVRRVPAPPG